MHLNEENKAKLSLILSMVIFGTIGLFRKYIDLPSSLIAMSRGLTGMIFLLLLTLLRGQKPSLPDVRRNAPVLFLSGGLMGFNWIMLFEAYEYTSVATATLCYYMAPIIVILLSPLVLKERFTARKLICVLIALVGMAFVSGVTEAGFSGAGELRGVLLGLGAAAFYACVILLNKKLRGISSMDRTIVQLGVSAAVLLPYLLLTEDLSLISFTPVSAAMLLVVGVIHTGVAYPLYFGSLKTLKAQTVALFSYIDPVVAILLSAMVLREGMTLSGTIGAVMVLGATLVSELPERRKS